MTSKKKAPKKNKQPPKKAKPAPKTDAERSAHLLCDVDELDAAASAFERGEFGKFGFEGEPKKVDEGSDTPPRSAGGCTGADDKSATESEMLVRDDASDRGPVQFPADDPLKQLDAELRGYAAEHPIAPSVKFRDAVEVREVLVSITSHPERVTFERLLDEVGPAVDAIRSGSKAGVLQLADVLLRVHRERVGRRLPCRDCGTSAERRRERTRRERRNQLDAWTLEALDEGLDRDAAEQEAKERVERVLGPAED